METKNIQNNAKRSTKLSGSKLVPELRFKEFEGEWENRILKEFTKINQGLQIPISDRYSEKVEGSYFYITNEFIRKGAKKSYYIKNPTDSVICEEEDILMTRTGNTGQVVTGVKGAFHNNFFKIKFDGTCEKWFLYYFLTSYKTQHKILSLAGVSTIPDLNHGDFYKLKITTPLFPEQQKTASFLTAVDEKIQQLTRKKELLAQYKKGVMQKLFSQEIRFKKDNGENYPDWEEKKLGEVCEMTSSKRVYLSDYVDSGIPFYRGKEISELRLNQVPSDLLYITNERYEDYKSKYGVPKKNDILVTAVGTLGNVLRIKNNDPFYFKDGNLIWLRKIEENPSFIEILLQWNTRELLKTSIGSTQKALTMVELRKLKFNFPCIEEEQKIANYLSGLDTKIKSVATQITQTQNFKKGLLQKMFV